MANITVPGLPAKTGTILDTAYLHLNESSVDKKVTIAQLLAKIEAQYSADIVTFLGSANKAEGRANLSIDRRVTVDDANYTILATDKVVAQIGTMSAPRTFSLPAASTVQAGAEIIVIDESGSIDSTNKITVQRSGTDTIDGATSIEILQAYGILKLICDGANSWKIANRLIATQAEVDAWTNKLKLITPETLANRNIPSFRSFLGSNQVITTSTNTKLNMTGVTFDTEGWYDAATNYRFTPQKAGYYQFNAQCFMTGSNTNRAEIKFYKNGVEYSRGDSGGFSADMGFGNCDIIYMDGSSDYVELYLLHYSASAKTVSAGSALTFWAAHLIA